MQDARYVVTSLLLQMVEGLQVLVMRTQHVVLGTKVCCYTCRARWAADKHMVVH